ncbi:pseudo histidine-containing phosphotransfer protein 5-like [Fagus crenata]
MASNSLQQQIASMRQSFFDEGILGDEFIELENLETDTNPNFVTDVTKIYFFKSPGVIRAIEQALETYPEKLDFLLQKFKESSRRIGAKKVLIEANKIVQENNEGSRTALQNMKQEYNTLKDKLEAYLELVRQAKLFFLGKRQAKLAQSSFPPSEGSD